MLFALLEPMFHGIANVFDNYFVNKIFRNPIVLIFFSHITDLLFLPLIFVFGLPVIPAMSQIPIFAILGLINVTYIYPYLKALQSDDTSTVSSLFSMSKIFVPVLAFLFIGEILTLNQYIGFAMIIVASSLLTMDFRKKFRLNSSFVYMLIVSVILSIEAILYKFVLGSVDWVTAFTWSTVFSLLFVMPILLIGKYRKEIRRTTPSFKKGFKLFATEEFVTFVGSVGFVVAMSLAPVTLVKGVSSLQPVFVLLYAILFGKMFPKAFKEKVDGKSLAKKVIFFVIIILGGILAFYE